MEKKMNQQTGITLIALIITIVVLLILAGITIMYVIGDNSIFQKAQNAKEKTDEAIKNEQQYINQVDNMINGYANGIGTNTPTPEVPENPWTKVDRIAKAIASDDSITNDSTQATGTTEKGESYDIKVGDIFEVEYNGETRRVRVLGFKHDDLVNQTVYGGTHEKASISFEFLDFMTGEIYKRMNSSDTSLGSWAATQMRKDLNGYLNENAVQSGTIGGMGANLSNKAYIKQVKKKYIKIYNDASSVTTCNDYLWLLAASEIVNSGYQAGAYGIAVTSEGSQYKYYRGLTEAWNAESIGRTKKTSESGEANWWWLRSPRSNYNDGFCGIGRDGRGGGNSAATYDFGVAPGFCI